jgi:arylsulfatase A-like enzyme
MTDQQRFDAVGYVNPVVRTPNIDALAGESIVFTRAYTTNPSCVPARAALFTGKYPSRCGAPTYITYLPDDEVTFQQRLRDAGYRTAAVGKLHFGETNIERGYEDVCLVDSHGPKPNGDDDYQQFLRAEGQTENDLIEPAGRLLHHWKGNLRYYPDEFVGEKAKHWLTESRPTDKPWYLHVSFPGPHSPFDGTGLPEAALYDEASLPLPETTPEDLDGKPPHFLEHWRRIAESAGGSAFLSDEEIRRARLGYYANVSYIDRKIGEILEALRATGEYDNTLIILTTDHGEFMGEYGTLYKGQFLSEALMHVPFLIKPPVANFEGRCEDAFASTVDIPATCMAAAGEAVPADMDGTDLAPLWLSPENAERRADIYMEAQGLRGIRDERYKLVHYLDRDYGELYDLIDDPWERRNLWDDASLAEVKARLIGRILDHLLQTEPRIDEEWNYGAAKI